MADSDEQAEEVVERERRATNLELFLDLVFVFSVAQISALMAADLSVGGVLRGLLVAWLVWWLWTQFTWLGTAVDLEKQGTARILVLCAVPPTLLMAVAIPTAYTTGGAQFATAYFVVALWGLGIQGWSLWSDASTRRAFYQWAPGAAMAPAIVLVGGFASDPTRVWVWALAALIDVGAAFMAGRQADPEERRWDIDPAHFSERHALFVIIALGEVLVAAGVAASGAELTLVVGAGIVAAVTIACTYWWSYFGFIANRTEHALRQAGPADRARLARDVFSFLHFPLVAGIALYALVAKHLVAHPAEHLATADLVVLWLSVVGVLGGFMAMHWRMSRGVAPQRIVAIVAVGLICAFLGPLVSGVVTIGCVALVLALMQLVTLRRYQRLIADAG